MDGSADNDGNAYNKRGKYYSKGYIVVLRNLVPGVFGRKFFDDEIRDKQYYNTQRREYQRCDYWFIKYFHKACFLVFLQ
jgi:hypothetical protein